uniref:EF-hand domain-containing protein n=1 Tax=Calcidiscus leptoporus TaxID=127549 RepID=A0A7S0ILG9_9EUKA|mmetsp:Transcript_12584/g.29014  ORF Transcript_12584/g.29014 Transcript_12584/m.29014 type:complete len:341 (+) Transcript_12584:25-1047(+)
MHVTESKATVQLLEAGEGEGSRMGSTVCAARSVSPLDEIDEREARVLSSAPTRNASHSYLQPLGSDDPRAAKQDALSRKLTNRLHTLFLTSPLSGLTSLAQPQISTSCMLSSAEHADMHALFSLVCAAADDERSCLHEGEPERTQRSGEQLRLSWGCFQQAFGSQWNAPIVKRVFDLMQPDERGSVSFDAFQRVLAPVCSVRAPLGAKLLFAFQCLDLDGSEGISHSELHFALRLALANTAAVPERLLEQVLDHTFGTFELDSAGEISWRAFERYYSKRPQQAWLLVAPLRFNINRLTASTWMGLPDAWMVPDRSAGKAPAPAVVLERGHTPGRRRMAWL